MSMIAGHAVERADPRRDDAAGDVIVAAYRCASAGLSVGDGEAWRVGQRLLARHTPPGAAGPLFRRFYAFARTVIAASEGAPPRRPVRRRGLSGEEALVLRMIERSQHADPAGMLSAAEKLVREEELGAVFQSAQALARALAACGLLVRAPEGRGGRPAARAARDRPPESGGRTVEASGA